MNSIKKGITQLFGGFYILHNSGVHDMSIQEPLTWVIAVMTLLPWYFLVDKIWEK